MEPLGSEDIFRESWQNFALNGREIKVEELNNEQIEKFISSPKNMTEADITLSIKKEELQPELVCIESLPIDIKAESDANFTDTYNEKAIKEEHFVDSKFVFHEELYIKNEDEAEDQFAAKLAMDQIKNSHHPNKTEPTVFKCLNCSYQAHRKQNIARHVLNHMARTLKCSQCSYKTWNERVFRKHELNHARQVPKEKIKELHQCPQCSYTSMWRSNVIHHMLTHKNPDDVTWYQCPECPYKTKHRGNLTHRHMLIHKNHKKDVPMHKCTLCSYESFRKSCLRRHIQHIHRSKDIEVIHCQEEGCSFKTHHESYLPRHIREMHVCKRLFKCSKCSYQTNRASNFKAHELGHEDRNKWFSCTLCPYKATFKTTLNRHMLVHKSSSEIMWFQCSQCTFKTKYKDSLKKHKLVHNLDPARILNCSECSFKTVHASSFLAHGLVHKKPEEISEWFYCYLCTLRTTRKNNLAMHIRKMHRDSDGRINMQ